MASKIRQILYIEHNIATAATENIKKVRFNTYRWKNTIVFRPYAEQMQSPKIYRFVKKEGASMSSRNPTASKVVPKEKIEPRDQDKFLEDIFGQVEKRFELLDVVDDPEKRPPEGALKEMLMQVANAAPPLYSNVYLFQLQFSPQRRVPVLYGTFVIKEAHPIFFQRKVGNQRFEIPCKKVIQGLNAIMSHIAGKGSFTVLRGHWEDNTFYVTEIHSGSEERPFGGYIGDATLQTIITRLVYQHYPERVGRAYKQMNFSLGESGLKLLYEVLKPTMPPQYRSWVEYSLSILGSNMSRDEKSHTIRAISNVLSINWTPRPPKLPQLSAIKEQLDQDFLGMESVKKRVLEIAAQVRRVGTVPHWGILLHGPAGVGKTTIARAIANIMDMPLVELDLSTINDAEGLTGSSRLYTNARPGAILEKLVEVRDTNCVFLLNELDKAMGGKDRGNPADALLTLVDKLGFIDSFLETGIDTSNILFLATCNDIDRISKPLQDRFLRIDIDRYSRVEKKTIFTRHVLPRALRNANIAEGEVGVTDAFVDGLCRFYATEPGVRDLEQYAERIVGDFLLKAESVGVTQKVYSQNDLEELLGTRPVLQQTLLVGPGIAKCIFLANGQASIALVQAAQSPGSGGIQIIGASSEFHQDCCRAAYECAKKLSSIDFSTRDITLYLPSMLPPTNENYLGCAAFMAIMSTLTGKQIPSSSVFLGGCDLFGNILWDGNDLTAIIDRMERSNENCLYGPTSLANIPVCSDVVRIIQSYNVAALFEISDFEV